MEFVEGDRIVILKDATLKNIGDRYYQRYYENEDIKAGMTGTIVKNLLARPSHPGLLISFDTCYFIKEAYSDKSESGEEYENCWRLPADIIKKIDYDEVLDIKIHDIL